jgi:hypothetical protein
MNVLTDNGLEYFYNKLAKETETKEGNEISVVATQSVPVKITIYGNTIQDGTPSVANPVEIKNVINPKTSSNELSRGIEVITTNESGDTNSIFFKTNIGETNKYNELCKIGDIRDELIIENGKLTKIQRIEKIEQYIPGMTVTDNYISSTGEISNGATIYYVMDNPQTITYDDDYSLMLFNGLNHITVNSEVAPDINITVYNNNFGGKIAYQDSEIKKLQQNVESLVWL